MQQQKGHTAPRGSRPTHLHAHTPRDNADAQQGFETPRRGRGELPRRSTQLGPKHHGRGGGRGGGELPWRSTQSGPVHGRQTQSSDEARPQEIRGGNGKWSPGVQGFCAGVKKFRNQVAMATHHQERTLLRRTLLLYKTTRESHHRMAQSGWWVTGGYRRTNCLSAGQGLPSVCQAHMSLLRSGEGKINVVLEPSKHTR